MRAQDDNLEDPGGITFRVQTDRRKTEAPFSGTNERRVTGPPSVSRDERADVADGREHPTQLETARDRKPH